MQLAPDDMIKSSSLCAFVYLTIFLTTHCHVARSEIEILGSGVRPVNEPMGGPGPMSGDEDGPMAGGMELSGRSGESSSGNSEIRMSDSDGGGPRIIGLPRVGPLLNGGAPPANMWSGNIGGEGGAGGTPGLGLGLGGAQSGPGGGNFAGTLPSSSMNGGGGGGGGDGDGDASAILGLGPGGSPLGSGNVGFEGGNDGGISSSLGVGFGGSSFGSGAGNLEGSLGSNINRGAGGTGGGVSPNFGGSFGGSSFGSGGGNFEGPQGGPGGNVNGEGPASGGFSGGGGGFGGAGFGGGGFNGGGFSGGGFGGSDRGFGGYGGATMPPRAPSSQGSPEPQPETPKASSEENSEETGQGGGGEGGSGSALTSRRRTSLTDMFDMNAARALIGGALGTAGTGLLVGAGAGLLRGTRTGRRVGRLGRRVTIRLVRKKASLDRRISRRSGRKRRSVPENVKMPATMLASSVIDDVPDHLKMVHCGHHEVPNRGHDRDRFCHPEATWKTVLRMRPECVCAPGYVRNSWGDCISYDQCYHCIDKHHLNMDYNLCESKCPLVCNQPINMNCPDTCYQECACRPGYIRMRPNGGPCISIKKCLPGCSSHNQYFTLCSSPCPATCANPFPTKCPKFCAGEGCVCKPGYVVLRHEPLVCVRLEECPGFRNRCPGENQVYTPCKPSCPEACWDKQPRMCTTGCAGTGCVCKQGFVMKSANPLVCVHRAQCAMFNHTSHFMHTKSL